MKLRNTLILVALTPFALGLLGSALFELLSCRGGPDRVEVCTRMPGVEAIVTLLTIYMGWLFVFVTLACIAVFAVTEAYRALRTKSSKRDAP